MELSGPNLDIRSPYREETNRVGLCESGKEYKCILSALGSHGRVDQGKEVIALAAKWRIDY